MKTKHTTIPNTAPAMVPRNSCEEQQPLPLIGTIARKKLAILKGIDRVHHYQ